MPPPWWLALYAGLALLSGALALGRKGPILVSGRRLVAANAVLVAIGAGTLLARAGPPHATSLLVLAGLLLAPLPLARRWLLVHGDPSALAAVLERCARMLRASLERRDGGFRIGFAQGELRIHLRPLPLRGGIALTFEALPPARKADLFRDLVAKQFPSLLPPLRLRA